MAIYKLYAENAAYQAIETLKTNRNKRHKRRAFFVEGVRNINAAAQYGWKFDAFIYTGDAKLSKWARDIITKNEARDIYELTPVLMKKLSSKTDASEIAAIVHMRDDTDGGTGVARWECAYGDNPASFRNINDAQGAAPVAGAANDATIDGTDANGICEKNHNPIFVLSDRPSGKGNLGTLMRSCDAFGVRALYRTGHSVDFYDPEVIASSTGSFFAVPFYSLPQSEDVDNLIDMLRSKFQGFRIIGASAHGAKLINEIDLTVPLMFLIGNETDGLSWRLKQIADEIAAIPMRSGAFASSLNVGCAATALLYEAACQRRTLSL